ncbi:hypothetical protein DM02DRAFT_234695 [Periconia macrospinosa]|uniref:Uncharacterized protein n=1 Tax=Periconia macrospinosa TaxID=97972 RepID=A0A2V1ECL5_9PLEO|nr:hypothetical protein DM02DRAFT_234695 [Periconia macrospinosa]
MLPVHAHAPTETITAPRYTLTALLFLVEQCSCSNSISNCEIADKKTLDADIQRAKSPPPYSIPPNVQSATSRSFLFGTCDQPQLVAKGIVNLGLHIVFKIVSCILGSQHHRSCRIARCTPDFRHLQPDQETLCTQFQEFSD